MIPNLFRKASLDRMSSPEELDLFVTYTHYRGWLVLLGLGCVVLSLLIWGIWGSIPIKIKGQGILVGNGGVVDLPCSVEGQVTDLRVAPGDFIQQGEAVARVFNQQWLNKAAPSIDKDQLVRAAMVVSPYTGRVLEVKINKGEWVKQGTNIMSLELSDQAKNDLKAVLYIPLEEGKKIRPGMEVQISPSLIKKEEYGFLLGTVSSVSAFPVTSEKMMKLLGNKELVERFISKGSPVEVRVELRPEAGTVSGYRWSSRKGPPLAIEGGTPCQGEVILGKVRPVELAVPLR